MQNQDRLMMLNVAGNFEAVNPAEWRKRENTTVQVGVGSVSRERRMVALETIMAKQNEIIANGGMGTLVQPFQVYQTLRDMTDSFGLQPQAYFTDPRTLPPPPPPQPDANAELALTHARALVMDAESKMQRNQIDVARVQAEQQIRFRELELRQAELQLKADIERQKADLVLLQSESKGDREIANLEIEIQKQDAEKRLEALELELKTVQQEKDREVEIYKNQMNNLTKLVQEDMKTGGNDFQKVIDDLKRDNEMLRKQIEDFNGTEG